MNYLFTGPLLLRAGDMYASFSVLGLRLRAGECGAVTSSLKKRAGIRCLLSEKNLHICKRQTKQIHLFKKKLRLLVFSMGLPNCLFHISKNIKKYSWSNYLEQVLCSVVSQVYFPSDYMTCEVSFHQSHFLHHRHHLHCYHLDFHYHHCLHHHLHHHYCYHHHLSCHLKRYIIANVMNTFTLLFL